MAYFGHGGGEERSVDLSDLSDMLRGGPSARVPTQAPVPSINKDDDDDGSKGRIFAAVSGNRDGWHERGRASALRRSAMASSPAAAAAAAHCVMKVCHAPRVAVRSAPSVGGRVIGTRSKGEEVLAVSTSENGKWVRLADGNRETETWGGEAWMMVVHDELGRLLRPVGGARIDSLPAERLKLAPSSAKSAPSRLAQKGDAPASSLSYYKVVHGPSVVVRSDPGLSGRIVGTLRLGDVVPASQAGEEEEWLSLAGTKGFVQQRHRDLGLLLEKCREDGSAYYY